MSGPYAKQVQVYSPALNSTAAGSAGFYRSSSAAPFHSRRSQTVDKGYRDMNPLESSFNYDRPIRDESVRESLQSPYINGRKNQNYINPTFQSTSFLNASLDTQRNDALSRGRAQLQKTGSQTNVRSASVSHFNLGAPAADVTPTAREVSVAPKRVEISEAACEPVELKPSQSVKNINEVATARPGRRTSDIPAGIIRGNKEGRVQSVAPATTRHEIAQDTTPRREVVKDTTPRQDNVQELNVCDGCINYQLADEVNERRKNSRRHHLELEREILERNAYAQKLDRENQLRHREVVVETSKANFDSFREKAHRVASRERGADEDVELKVNTDKSIAAESLRSLQRYQSMLDKMYESSVKKIGERKAELKKSQTHNKFTIDRNEKNAEPKGHVKQNDFQYRGDKSMLDNLYEASHTYMSTKANERRRASEYNYQSSEKREKSRPYSPAKPIQDPFKPNTEALEDGNNGVLDKMFYNSMERWKKAKSGIYDSSRSNREASADKRSRARNNDEYVQEQWSGYKKGWRVEGNSLLDNVYESDQKGLTYRKNINLDCAQHNRETGFSPEKHQFQNLELYYNSPTKKVNDPNAIDYESWSGKERGIFAKIQAATERLEQNRREQYNNLGGSIKKQMAEASAYKIEEKNTNRNFKETPLLVCAHKNNVMYCNVCNRKVPMNKISKIVGEYQKLMKGRGRK